MKSITIVSCLLVLLSSLFSEIGELKFKPEEFDDSTYVIKYYSDTSDFKDPIDNNSQSYNYEIREKHGKYQMRYILFKQTGEIDESEYNVQTAMWAWMVIANITGSDEKADNTSAFSEADVKAEFNADLGYTNFSVDIETDYASEYKYIMINFFCKKDLGIMCHTVQFNDLEWVKTEEFLNIFHSFNFY